MKELSAIIQDSNGCHFECWWEGSLDSEAEVAKAHKHCRVPSPADVVVSPSWDAFRSPALVSGGNIADDERNRTQVKCVHLYLLNNGWVKRTAE